MRITHQITIRDEELQFDFVRSGGPGGQNVNKVATAVQLRFDINRSPTLSPDVRRRLIRLGGSRVTTDGVLIIDARGYRKRERNRRAARDRLRKLIREAARPPRRRKKTRPGRAARERRLKAKKIRSRKKYYRRPVSFDE